MWGFPMIFAIETSIFHGDLPAPAPGGGGQMDAVVDASRDQKCADRGSKTPQTWSMNLKFIFMLLVANNRCFLAMKNSSHNDKLFPFLPLFITFLPSMGGIGTVQLEVYGTGLPTLVVMVVLDTKFYLQPFLHMS